MDNIINASLFNTVKDLIQASKQHIAISVNAEMSMLYWKIGTVIRQEILKQERAEYGKQILATLSRELTVDYGKSFSEQGLRRMVQFAEQFPEEHIVATLSRQFSWSHFKEVLPISESVKREFYIQMCIHEKWSVRTFRERIQSDYLTALPSQQVLQEKLHKAVEIARHKMEQRVYTNTKTGLPSD